MQKVGILTAGGDCPGLNSAIVASIFELERRGLQPVLIRDGYKGLLSAADGDTSRSVFNTKHIDRALLYRAGGTFIGSSRTKLKDDLLVKAVKGVETLKLSGLIIIGGDGSLLSANRLSRYVPVAAIPKTIDNDVAATDVSIGFATAVDTAVASVEKVQDTARSHGDFFFVEVMGRRSGFLAAATALGARTDALVVPESSWSLESLLPFVAKSGIAVVSEGAWCSDLGDAAGRGPGGKLGGVASRIVKLLSATREPSAPKVKSVTLGHVLRGGCPSSSDRILARRFARQAANLAYEGRSGLCAKINDKVTYVALDRVELGRKYLTSEDLRELSAILPK